MGVYKKAVITDAGRTLLTKAVAGKATMQFSHAKTSAYIYPEGTDLTKLTDLQEIRQNVIPSNVQIASDTLISVRALFGNEQITEEYLIQNVGIYASDGDTEVLFAVCQAATPDQMPAYNGVAPSSFIYNVQLTVSQATEISLTVNTAGTATTQDILELEQKKVNGSGGDISETVISAVEESETEYPVPVAGDSVKTVIGKVQKFFADIRNWMTGVCLLGQIVNNCVTDNPGLPLSAAQGKVLMDLYTVLNTKLASKLTNGASGHITEISLKDFSGLKTPTLKIEGYEHILPISTGASGVYTPVRFNILNKNPSTGKRTLKVDWWADGALYTSYIDVTS